MSIKYRRLPELVEAFQITEPAHWIDAIRWLSTREVKAQLTLDTQTVEEDCIAVRTDSGVFRDARFTDWLVYNLATREVRVVEDDAFVLEYVEALDE